MKLVLDACSGNQSSADNFCFLVNGSGKYKICKYQEDFQFTQDTNVLVHSSYDITVRFLIFKNGKCIDIFRTVMDCEVSFYELCEDFLQGISSDEKEYLKNAPNNFKLSLNNVYFDTSKNDTVVVYENGAFVIPDGIAIETCPDAIIYCEIIDQNKESSLLVDNVETSVIESDTIAEVKQKLGRNLVTRFGFYTLPQCYDFITIKDMKMVCSRFSYQLQLCSIEEVNVKPEYLQDNKNTFSSINQTIPLDVCYPIIYTVNATRTFVSLCWDERTFKEFFDEVCKSMILIFSSMK